MKTSDVLKEVLAGKLMSESSKKNYEAVFNSDLSILLNPTLLYDPYYSILYLK